VLSTRTLLLGAPNCQEHYYLGLQIVGTLLVKKGAWEPSRKRQIWSLSSCPYTNSVGKNLDASDTHFWTKK
jgi:hypothetical protein